MKTAVVILNWNTKEYLRKFLPGLIASGPGPDAEVIVADSASTDGSMEMMTEEFPTVRQIRLEENFGFTGGYNRALSQVDAELMVLINSDVEVTPGWLTPLVRWMEEHPDCGACAPKLLSFYDHGSFEYAGAAGGLIDSWGYTFCRGRVLKRVEKDTGQYDRPADVLWATGACLMVRREVWQHFGGLDERFFAHMEEIDLCWRMQLEGWKVQVVPQSVVYHLGGGTLHSDSPWKLQLNFRNNLLLLENNLARTYVTEGLSPSRALRKANRRIGLRMMLDGGSALVYALTGRWEYVKAVYKAHESYRTLRRPVTRAALETYQVRWGKRAGVAGRWKGSIILQAMLRKDGIFAYLRNQKYSSSTIQGL